MLKVSEYYVSPGKVDFLFLTPGLPWWPPLRAFAIPRRWEEFIHEQQEVRCVLGWGLAICSLLWSSLFLGFGIGQLHL